MLDNQSISGKTVHAILGTNSPGRSITTQAVNKCPSVVSNVAVSSAVCIEADDRKGELKKSKHDIRVCFKRKQHALPHPF